MLAELLGRAARYRRRADRGLDLSGRGRPRRAVHRGRECVGTRLRQGLERRRNALYIGDVWPDMPQQERPRFLPEPRALALLLAGRRVALSVFLGLVGVLRDFAAS